ncbi:MAG: hypothetical protein IJD09_02070 [Clostridia bacterium]|nr:hypothetical protein [Clostridia bacterium]
MMNRKFIKVLSVLMIALVLSSMLTIVSAAYTPYNSYNYNYYGEAIETPAGYAPEYVYTGQDLGIGDIGTAVDVYVSPQNEVYLLDYSVSDSTPRIHIFDEDMKHIVTLDSFTYNGAPYKMNLPESLVVDQYGYIYVCDTGNHCVVKLDKDQRTNVIQIVTAPKSDMFKGDFKPSRIAIAKNMSLYVISSGTLEGIIEFDSKGTFLRFFGAPNVQMSVADMVELAWRRIYRSLFGQNVDESFLTFVPTEFENLVVDEYGFVFAVVMAAEDNSDQMFKMNFLGNNILDPTAKSTKKVSDSLSKVYGDLIRRSTVGYGNVFMDIAVDQDGFFTLMDKNLGKIFEYDSEGNLVSVYGGLGQQHGMFQAPKAIAKLGKKTVVLDSYYATVTVFELTDYGETFHKGIVLYNKGLYADAENYWFNVLKQNANCEMAHIGLGKVYYQYGNYEQALFHFKAANDRMNYSSSYSLYREQKIADNFGTIMTLLVVLVVLMVAWRLFGKHIIEAIKERRGGGNDDDAEILE